MSNSNEQNRGEKHELPELQHYLHRPVGHPQAREIKSQKAQLNSVHQHGTQKSVKMGISNKTGLRDMKHNINRD
ncbi:hypothetical protein [Desulforamulus aquiferis]|uniref:Uncharacterized protein n=1 Tax=Desulforamulus aquiferis TaxID=1397668 RepID=A0AAW7ZHI5_9FIRM|nr:hypothetical protein [Desulforamulus aquiferis]MDO7788752.1 hypothetical protein [Desulforamulus aquiferis]RYD05354.1 hypothetical protein N752_09665 [Desulforamulus aquiferis]